jgi:putative transposase
MRTFGVASQLAIRSSPSSGARRQYVAAGRAGALTAAQVGPDGVDFPRAGEDRGWAVSAMNNRHLAFKALDMALRRRCPDAGLLHHSAQVGTYASDGYQALHESPGITVSMSRRGNCYDNAAMESSFSTVESQLGEHFADAREAKGKLFDYLESFYNQERMHSGIATLRRPSSSGRKRRHQPVHRIG